LDQVTDFTKEDEEVETPRVCMACGGRSCRWCSRGYQDQEQQKDWAKFRVRSRKISSTYSLLEKIVRELIDSLDKLGDQDLANRGRKCLEDWMSASPDTPERREASMMISVFQSQAVVALMKARTPG
jgi:hypothetical protein